MIVYLIILFTVIPAVELTLLIKIGTVIGSGNTILLIVLTGIIGAYLARLQGFTVLQNIQNSLNQGQMPTDSMLDGVMILVGGIVLLTPGFITDVLGFALLIPWTRSLIKYLLQKRFTNIINDGTTVHIKHSKRNDHQDFEDAEFYD